VDNGELMGIGQPGNQGEMHVKWRVTFNV